MRNAIVVGGGFYGAAIAVYLAGRPEISGVTLIEQEADLLTRASLNNQARIHNGYHYPRSFTTAFRSRVNLPRFVRDFPDAVRKDFTKLYAVSRRNSKVTAKQFERFCQEIGARLEPAPQSLRSLFEPKRIEEVFLVEEYAFDAVRLAAWARRELEDSGVETRFNQRVSGIGIRDGALRVECGDGAGLSAAFVFNCTYSGLNQIRGGFPGTQARLKQEITEMALVRVPAVLRELGITVMDGPFFSLMPFPSRGLHTLSHVRYTPHLHWMDQPGIDPYARLRAYDRETRVDRMMRDAARYLPALEGAAYVDSLFEVKTVLIGNESDDGRPILLEKHRELPGCYSILGGKIDNIYDVLEKLDREMANG